MADSEEDPKCAKFFRIPQRYILGIMAAFAVVNMYTLRTCLSVAINEMIYVPSSENTTKFVVGPCVNYTKGSGRNDVDESKMYPWTAQQRGMILSVFYAGYIISHAPGGFIADKWGAKHVLGGCVLGSSICSIMTAPVIYWSDGSAAFFITLRFFAGLSQGVGYPALSVIIGQWIPKGQRGFWSSAIYAGSQIGTIMGNALSGLLIGFTKEWHSVFYFFGFLGVLWWIVWLMVCFSSPDKHPCISVKEKKYLTDELASSVTHEKKIVPWRHLLLSLPVWSMVVVQLGHAWGWFTVITDLPKYMKDILGLNIKMNGLLSSIPYVIMWFTSLGSGYLCDWLIKSGKMSTTTARRIFNTIAAVVPGVFMVITGHIGCSHFLAVSMLTIALGGMGAYYCGLKVNPVDLSPNYSGILMAMQNGIGSIIGMTVSGLTSVLTKDGTLIQWQTVFYLSCLALVGTNLQFLFFGSGETQWWNDGEKVKEYNRKKNEERLARATQQSA